MVRLPLPHRISSKAKAPISSPTTQEDVLAAPTPVNSDSRPLILITSVICGRNLAAKDRNGTSDPYLVVTLGDSRQSTPTISKTLNPEWNVSFELPVVGVPLLECVCWDKDRFGKDYMGEFDIPLEDLFIDGRIHQEPKWYNLHSKSKSGKDSDVSGQIQLQFSLFDPSNPSGSPEEISAKFRALVSSCDPEEEEVAPVVSAETDEKSEETSDDTTDDLTKPGVAEKRRRRLRLARLRNKSIAARAYEFSGAKEGVSGIVFMEVGKILDLPPERNVTRTSFDMDPFVVTSLGRKTLRTRVIRHNLNPVFDEKMVFQVMKHEQSYSFSFTVMDRDKLSGNDFVASANFPLQALIQAGPVADPETGLYQLPGLSQPTVTTPLASKSRFRLAISRSSSANSLSKLARPALKSRTSATSLSSQFQPVEQQASAPGTAPSESAPQLNLPGTSPNSSDGTATPPDADDLKSYIIPLVLKNKDRWEDKHAPELHVRAKYMPYPALRQQFWRVMLKQYDADDSGRISKVELTAMLDTLGSTLKESTIDNFFHTFAEENEPSDTVDLTFDQAVICLEEKLQALQKKTVGSQLRKLIPNSSMSTGGIAESENQSSEDLSPCLGPSISVSADYRGTTTTTMSRDESSSSEEGTLHPDDLADERGEEHVIELRECPLCHQPRLAKRSDADIITHIATCASQDWRQVDNLVMGGFVTSSQAQRKWYSKVITKISYGGYKLGANSANILVQDRITGQINEERMSVYVRLGIRLLYKGLKSRDMEKKRIRKMLKSLSIKQGKKYDDPASASQIEDFINFHQLDMSEVLLPLEEFKSFNEFFYRALKPGARPCSAPDNPDIIVSPADCRSVVFDRIDDATKIWVKGREFSLERLLGKAYPEDVQRYKGGALGIFRLAPQDYHRFHIPVDGVLGTPKTIEGEYYTVNPMAIRSALDVYGENVRILVPIDSVSHGRVMFICVGAMMVGSTVITRQAGEKVTRAEELGYFKFGGSTVLLLFEPGRMNFDSDLLDNSKGALETLVRVGMSIGHSPHVPQYTPDMRKPDELISSQEREDANRKIGGGSTPAIQLEDPSQ
ncbi:phosphatidylserine decarboxylase, putative [Coccidioides posadasii C735 delta SOWgp]|uniref:Phosphatidylserine decarboxylase proenzyme 2 n=1 Tax=Coccidioides posadasii (strain C735) TaxID=222929 RepID=C5PFK0_COCP7|nr:phosphatidylserine decarboxylase, putative [Coccidioides posadasii C735 delta SOWgp]EER24689.1 phosphatidylserine decarboxylase, putative [Coccidioides posadasii C735 delta SOWgp]|eukprot:XP_003066834.1 phosphatidylserine decarboxylase, putative [Coccidioides posadasii C735 delta SOWgp]